MSVTWHQHILGEWLPIERIGAAIQQMSRDYGAIHDLAGWQRDRIYHQCVHQRVTEFLGSICVLIFSLLIGN